jgi:Cu/Zn superoxide dismutase
MRRSRVLIVAPAAVIATTALATASPAAPTTTDLSASLSGSQEVPTKGNPAASGKAEITISSTKGLCYSITLKKLSGTPQAAHIHRGKKGKAGPVYVALFAKPKTPKYGKISGCASATKSKQSAIKAKPGDFYVNVHTKKYPDGEVRGQLSAKKS